MRYSPQENSQNVSEKKKKNSERRKEKSRDAARCRRSKESEIFAELSSSLPLSAEKTSQLDKASVMRLAIAYLKLEMALQCAKNKHHCIKSEEEAYAELATLQSIDGFLMLLAREGDIVYLSDNVSQYLGLTQLELMGQSLFEYSHPCDHDELSELLLFKKNNKNTTDCQSFFFRMKCTLTSKGLSVNLKSANYKVLHCKGYVISGIVNDSKMQYLALVAEPIPHPYLLPQSLGSMCFVTKHSLDMKFTYVEDRVIEFLGYQSQELIGKSIYHYYHAGDQDMLLKCFKILFTKGQVTMDRFRFLARNGGYCWTVTMATVMYSKQNQKPDHVVCIHEIINKVENQEEIYFIDQIGFSEKTKCTTSKPVKAEECDIEAKTKEAVREAPLPIICKRDDPHRPYVQSATSTIFAPKTADMSTGFMVFSEDDPGVAIFKEDVKEEDLTHLAPSAGDDTCIPLDMSAIFPDMLDGVLFSNDTNTLTNSKVHDNSSGNSLLENDLSFQANTPEVSSEQISNSGNEASASECASDMETDEFEGRAPYIPMSDDLPLISPQSDFSDIMLNFDVENRAPQAVDLRDYIHTIENSSLAKLLTSNIVSLKPESETVLNSPCLKAELTKPIGDKKLCRKRSLEEDSKWFKKTKNIGLKTLSSSVQTDGPPRTVSVSTQTPLTPPRYRDMCTSPIMFREGHGGNIVGTRKSIEPSSSVLLNLLVSGEDSRAGYRNAASDLGRESPPSFGSLLSSPQHLGVEIHDSLCELTCPEYFLS